MTFLIKQLVGLIRVLHSETGTNQIAAGVACGLIMGLCPGLSLQTLIVFFAIFVFRIQGGAAFASAALFAGVGFVLDPVLHAIGASVLEAPALHGLWVAMAQMPIVPFTRFNNSVVMGAGIFGLVMAPVVFWLTRILVIKYRVQIVARVQDTRLWKAFHATRFYKWYESYERFKS